jgi:hypothetical protein
VSTNAEGTTDCRCGTTKQMLKMDGSHGGRGGDLIYARRFGDILRREISRMEIEEWLRKTKTCRLNGQPAQRRRCRRTCRAYPQNRPTPSPAADAAAWLSGFDTLRNSPRVIVRNVGRREHRSVIGYAPWLTAAVAEISTQRHSRVTSFQH